MLSGKELELLCEMDTANPRLMRAKASKNGTSIDKRFLEQIQKAALEHMAEKNEIRDALGLLKLCHNMTQKKERAGVETVTRCTRRK